MPRSYQADMSRLRNLSPVGTAVIYYGLSLTPNNELRGGYSFWVPYPSNFFGFRVQPKLAPGKWKAGERNAPRLSLA